MNCYYVSLEHMNTVGVKVPMFLREREQSLVYGRQFLSVGPICNWAKHNFVRKKRHKRKGQGYREFARIDSPASIAIDSILRDGESCDSEKLASSLLVTVAS